MAGHAGGALVGSPEQPDGGGSCGAGSGSSGSGSSGSASSGSGGTEGGTCLLDLPDHLLLEVASHADRASLCSLARTCRRLGGVAEHPDLWPAFSDDGPILRRVRRMLASALRIPPQAFTVSLDFKRSRRFPVCAPAYGLRPLLRVPDPEALAASLSQALQERIERPSVRAWRPSRGAAPAARSPPPAAVAAVCRADRACVRFGLRAGPAVLAVLHETELLGWPPGFVEAAVGGGACDTPASGGFSGSEGAAVAGRAKPSGSGGAAESVGGAGVGSSICDTSREATVVQNENGAWEEPDISVEGLAAAVSEVQQRRLAAAAQLLRARAAPAFRCLSSRRAPTPEEPRERLAAARPHPNPSCAGASGALTAIGQEGAGAPAGFGMSPAAAAGVDLGLAQAPCGSGARGCGCGGELGCGARGFAALSSPSQLARAARRLEACMTSRDQRPWDASPAQSVMKLVCGLRELSARAGAVADAAADAAAATAAAGSAPAPDTAPCRQHAPDAPWRLPGAAAARDACVDEAASAGDLQLCLSGLHDAPSALARACRTHDLRGVWLALQAASEAWEEHGGGAAVAAAAGGLSAAPWGGPAQPAAAAARPLLLGLVRAPQACDGCCTAAAWEPDAQLIAGALAEAATAEVEASGGGGGLSQLSGTPQAAVVEARGHVGAAVVRHALAVEVLRVTVWCMWVLGAI